MQTRLVLAPHQRAHSDSRCQTATFILVTTGHSRSQNGVAPLAYAGGPCYVRLAKSDSKFDRASLPHGLPDQVRQ